MLTVIASQTSSTWAMIAGNFGKRVTTGVNPRADLNLDGEIDVIDLAIVAANLGRTCS